MLGKRHNFDVLYRPGFLKKFKMFKENANIGVLFSNDTLWLYKSRTLPWIFFDECSYFFRDLYLFSEPPKNHCFDKALQEQLSLCYRRNTLIALRTPVKSHKGLQDAESFAKSCPS